MYLVAYGLSVKQNFFLQKLKKTWREELEVLDIWLLRGTRSLGKLESSKQLLCCEPDNFPPDTLTVCHFNVLHPKCGYKEIHPYLGCFGLTDSQSFSKVGIHCIIGFPFSLGWLDPIGNHLDEEARGNKVNIQRFISSE